MYSAGKQVFLRSLSFDASGCMSSGGLVGGMGDGGNEVLGCLHVQYDGSFF